MLDDKKKPDHTRGLAFWDADDNVTGWTAHLWNNVGAENVSEYAAPARTRSVEDLPRLYLECPQLDILLQENLEYVRRFGEANISTEFHLYEGLTYGFAGLAPTAVSIQRARQNRIRAMTTF